MNNNFVYLRYLESDFLQVPDTSCKDLLSEQVIGIFFFLKKGPSKFSQAANP